ncbi:MAG TPA: DEAD/DEAH box helicase family protein [Blastocatellia bacterium]|jgi:DNA excision repair protein ERCC-3
MTFFNDQLAVARAALDHAEESLRQAKEKTLALSNSIYPALDEEAFRAFLKQPYVLIQRRAHEWYCIVPKFIDFAVGWLEFATDSYNVFLVNRYTLWLGSVPESISEATGLEQTPVAFSVADGLLTFDQNGRAAAERYRPFLSRIKGDVGYITRGKEFQLLAQMIDDGYLPFAARPVATQDYREPSISFTCGGRYQFQQDAYLRWLELGAVGVYWMTGAGKSFFAMKCLDSINGRKLIVVPTKTLIDQWKDYFRKYAPRLGREEGSHESSALRIVTYQAYEKVAKHEWDVVLFDECHRLPATSFSRLATLKTKYRIGLSASPYREDGRTNYIFALTGFPIGHDWRELMKTLGKQYHEVNVWIVPSKAQKINKAAELFDSSKKTLIFSDAIDLGAQIAKRLNLPHVHGGTNGRMTTARQSPAFVASRVMDMGVSLDDLEHIIEVDFLFGSRQQEIQRTGRLFHSLKKSRHDILMTKDEFDSHQKRLHGLVERGFKVTLHQ